MENEFITVKEIREVIRILENLEFETIFEEAHFTEAEVTYEDAVHLLKTLEIQLLSFQGNFGSIVEFNHKLDSITQGIQAAQQATVPSKEKLNTLLTTCGIEKEKFLSFISTFIGRFAQLKGIDKELKSVKDCYDNNKHLSADTKNTSNENQIDGILRKIAAYAFVIEKYCLFGFNLCTFIGLCDKSNGNYYFKNLCEESLRNLLKKEEGYSKDYPVFYRANLLLLLAQNYAKNAHEIYNETDEIRRDIRSHARNIA